MADEFDIYNMKRKLDKAEKELEEIKQEKQILMLECDRLVKERGELRKKIVDVQPVNRRISIDDKLPEWYRREILQVKALGEMIGYGNIMDIASNLWAEQLKRDGFPDSGAFYPTIISEIKEGKLKDTLIEERLQKIEYYKILGIWEQED